MYDFTIEEIINYWSKVETFKPILNFSNYEVSSFGFVKNKNTGRILKPALVGLGKYPVVTLSQDNTPKNYKIPTIVANAFLGRPPFEDALVAHNDGNTSNNNIRNLRWASSLENQADSIRHDTRPRGSKVKNSKLKESDIPVIREKIRQGIPYTILAEEYDVDKTIFTLIKQNKIWKHAKGFNNE